MGQTTGSIARRSLRWIGLIFWGVLSVGMAGLPGWAGAGEFTMVVDSYPELCGAVLKTLQKVAGDPYPMCTVSLDQKADGLTVPEWEKVEVKEYRETIREAMAEGYRKAYVRLPDLIIGLTARFEDAFQEMWSKHTVVAYRGIFDVDNDRRPENVLWVRAAQCELLNVLGCGGCGLAIIVEDDWKTIVREKANLWVQHSYMPFFYEGNTYLLSWVFCGITPSSAIVFEAGSLSKYTEGVPLLQWCDINYRQ